MKTRRTPQQKKALSYARDRVEVFAEARANARKAVRLHKKVANSAHRQSQELELRKATAGAAPEQLEKVDAGVVGVSRRSGKSAWRKVPAAPLLKYRDYLEVRQRSLGGRVVPRDPTASTKVTRGESTPAKAARTTLAKKGVR